MTLTEERKVERDYSGFSTRELSQCFFRHLDDRSLDSVARSIDMHPLDLRKIVVYHKHDYVGLHKADRIMMGVGVSVAAAERDGHLHAIPGRALADARRMAEDEIIVREGRVPTKQEIEVRARELMDFRHRHLRDMRRLVPVTPDIVQDDISQGEKTCATSV